MSTKPGQVQELVGLVPAFERAVYTALVRTFGKEALGNMVRWTDLTVKVVVKAVEAVIKKLPKYPGAH